jgi:hypothetical protein
MDDIQESIFRLVSNGQIDLRYVSILFTYLKDSKQTLTLADGRTVDYKTLLLMAANQNTLWFHRLAALLGRNDQVTVQGRQYNRLGLLAAQIADVMQLNLNPQYTNLEQLYADLAMRMFANETIQLPDGVFSRTELLFKSLDYMPGNQTKAERDPLKFQLAFSLNPGEVVVFSNGKKLDHDDVFRLKPVDDRMCVGMAISLLPEQVANVKGQHMTADQLLQYALNGDLNANDMPEEDAPVDFDTLSVGGEDERQAFVAAVATNTVQEFAESALRRRYRLPGESAPKRPKRRKSKTDN